MYYNYYMQIIWDAVKYRKLKADRGIDLDEIKILLEGKQYFDILENPGRNDQFIVPLLYRAPLNIHYLLRPAAKPAYCVPFGGHICTNMAFSCALSAAFSLGLITKLNN
jgi:hypothetical protein